jgi:hypothetical protein
MKVEGDGISLPPGADASFAVRAVLPRAMEGGFNLKISRTLWCR